MLVMCLSCRIEELSGLQLGPNHIFEFWSVEDDESAMNSRIHDVSIGFLSRPVARAASLGPKSNNRFSSSTFHPSTHGRTRWNRKSGPWQASSCSEAPCPGYQTMCDVESKSPWDHSHRTTDGLRIFERGEKVPRHGNGADSVSRRVHHNPNCGQRRSF